MSDLTPAMRQYLDIKEGCKEAILFFRMGDFYEMFFEDARIASRTLGIALTTRDKGKDNPIPMCGVPYHAASHYITRLVKEGYRVAICEQVEDLGTDLKSVSSAKGIVKREITRVITPGVALEDGLLEAKTSNFVATLTWNGDIGGIAYMDVTTGEFKVTELADRMGLLEEVKRVEPKEVILPEGLDEVVSQELSKAFDKNRITPWGHPIPPYEEALDSLKGHFQVGSLDGFGCSSLTEGIRASSILLQYVEETQKRGLDHIKRLSPYHPHQFMVIDSTTKRNLELTHSMRDGSKKGTLLGHLDRTRTAMGGRRLRAWLDYPLRDPVEIRKRLDAVEGLMEDRFIRQDIQGLLANVYDLERLTSRVVMKSASPRDMIALRDSLKRVPEIKTLLMPFNSALLKGICLGLDGVEEVVSLIERGIVEDPPLTIREGGVIRDGFHEGLDQLRETTRDGRGWIARLEAQERVRSGIGSLKVGYNKVFGYYIEVTKANLAQVPPHYIRKQTLVNAERFITPELKEMEAKVLGAEERLIRLELEIFHRIGEEVAGFVERIQATADLLSGLDCLAGLAQVAEEMNYVRPKVDDGDIIHIVGGRHPVIEAMGGERFVPNDCILDGETNQVLIITGPNMAGKSTYIRQVALITLMAQIGSFVPAEEATIGCVDRIFTRVGASDDITRGQSTFMVEMCEAANIINNATSRSLIILDEIGRGTSTYDGLSIAWAVAEYIHDNLKAKTLFATHYHELTELALTEERVKNYNMVVKEWDDKVIFLRKVLPGGSNRSYGIQVARLAGFPQGVIDRAREVLANLEKGELNEVGMPRIASSSILPVKGQLNLFVEKDPLREELRGMDVNRMTPLEALLKLNRLKGMV